MAVYYVSDQRGDDARSAAEAQSPTTPWKTITKAVQAVAAGDTVYVGPGIYRERITLQASGAPGAMIEFICDPDARYVVGDAPGTRVRLTGADASENPTSGTLWNFNNRPYNRIQSFLLDGVTGSTVIIANNTINQFVEDCLIMGSSAGIAGGRCYRVRVIVGDGICFSQSRTVRCIGISSGAVLSGGLHYWSIGISASLPATASAGLFHCLVIGGGSSGMGNAAFAHCVGLASSQGGAGNGFYARDVGLVCSGSGYGLAGSDTSGVRKWLVRNDGGGASHPLGNLGPFVIDPGALLSLLEPTDATATTSGALAFVPQTMDLGIGGVPIDLSVERLVAFTPPETGTSVGIAIYVATKAAAGAVTAELQKFTDGVWSTQRSATLPVDSLTTGIWNEFLWDQGAGDDQLTTEAARWRYRITADANAAGTTIRVRSSTNVSYVGLFIPDEDMDQDALGRPAQLGDGRQSLGAHSISDVTPTWAVGDYHTAPPGIRINRAGMQTFEVPAAAGLLLRVSVQAKHIATGGLKPQIQLGRINARGGWEEIASATHTGADDTWQALAVSYTPTSDELLQVRLYARDTAPGAYSLFSDIQTG